MHGGRVGAGWFGLAAAAGLGAAERAGGGAAAGGLQAARARIERHRMADGVVRVADGAGRPAPGARVEVVQTRHAFLFGCNVFLWGRVGSAEDEATYRQRFAELCNYATLPFYWASYERERGKPDHERVERMARWCRRQGIATKGHPLAWNYADPPWLPESSQEILRLQLERINDCVSRFRGLIDIWDVVNEAAEFERASFWKRAPKMTRMWEETGRVAFVRQCFAAARAANRRAMLLINDYRTDEAYERVLDQLRDDAGRPLCDAIGIQSHMHGGVWSNERIWRTCERFARFGVPLHFTETTIVSGQLGWNVAAERGAWPSTPGGEARQADEAERFYTMVFSHPAVEAITWWDFADRGAWKGAPAGLLRRDLTPKPAYQRLRELIKGRWRTRTAGQTDSRGEFRFRGFRGDYQIVVRMSGREAATRTLKLPRGGAAMDVRVSAP